MINTTYTPMNKYVKETRVKTLHIIASCETFDQLTVAQNWCKLLWDQWEQYASKAHEDVVYINSELKPMYRQFLKLIQNRYIEISLQREDSVNTNWSNFI